MRSYFIPLVLVLFATATFSAPIGEIEKVAAEGAEVITEELSQLGLGRSQSLPSGTLHAPPYVPTSYENRVDLVRPPLLEVPPKTDGVRSGDFSLASSSFGSRPPFLSPTIERTGSVGPTSIKVKDRLRGVAGKIIKANKANSVKTLDRQASMNDRQWGEFLKGEGIDLGRIRQRKWASEDQSRFEGGSKSDLFNF